VLNEDSIVSRTDERTSEREGIYFASYRVLTVGAGKGKTEGTQTTEHTLYLSFDKREGKGGYLAAENDSKRGSSSSYVKIHQTLRHANRALVQSSVGTNRREGRNGRLGSSWGQHQNGVRAPHHSEEGKERVQHHNQVAFLTKGSEKKRTRGPKENAMDHHEAEKGGITMKNYKTQSPFRPLERSLFEK